MLLEVDSSAIEAVLVGWLARSPRYIRLAKAGVHGWLAAHMLGQPIPLDLPDADLAAACRKVKREHKDLYEVTKRVCHLSNYMGTPERIAEEYPDEFPDIEMTGPRGGKRIIPGAVKAREIQDALFSTEPGQDVKRWQRHTLEVAYRENVLKTPFGIWHYFYDVFTYDRKSKSYKLGDDAKRAVAFAPQSMASSIQDLILLSIRHDAPWLFAAHGLAEVQKPERYAFRLPVHDSLIFDVPKHRIMEAARIVYRAFTQPWPQLGGLSIGAEVSIGPNLGGMTVLGEHDLCAA